MAQIYRHESRDVDDQAQALNDWEQAYEQLGCGRFRGSCWQMVMDQGVVRSRRMGNRTVQADR